MSQDDSSPKSLLQEHGLKAKKSWGQNFLHNESVLRSIAEASANKGEVVLEIGAGLGHLTKRLLERGAKVFAIERDRDMAEVLRRTFAEEPRFQLFEDNALTFDYAAFASAQATPPSIVGNLPYHITSPILFRLLEVIERFSRVTCMVQREVCDRIVAAPDTDEYSALSVLIGARAKARRLFLVSRGSFYPVPKVDSAVFQLTPIPGVDGAFWDGPFRQLINASFHARRKTLWNNLKEAYPPEKVKEALASLSIDPGRRAETISVEDFWRLAKALSS